MGAWGIHFDESDGSLDFIDGVNESRDWNEVDQRVRDYVDNGGYDDADEALAALELVAAALGRPSPRLQSDLSEWAKGNEAGAKQIQSASIEALTLVREKSELNELWAEADDYGAWQATLVDLQARLQN